MRQTRNNEASTMQGGGRRAALVAALTMLAAASVPAFAEGEASAQPTEQRISPNTSIAIEDGRSDAARSEGAAAGGGPAAPPQTATMGPVPSSEVVLPPRGGSASHLRTGGGDTLPSSTASGLGSLRMLWPLAVVLGVVGTVYWTARRWMPAARVRDSGVMRTLGRLSLAPKHQMVAVQVGRRVLLVGVSPDRVSALGTIANPAEVADLLSRVAPRGQADVAFDPLLEAEASGYRVAVSSRARQAAPARNGGDGGTSRAVHELLEKVRSLQTR